MECKKKAAETGTVKDTAKSGLPCATTADKIWLLYRLSLSNRRATLRMPKRGFEDARIKDNHKNCSSHKIFDLVLHFKL